jgi:signal transduction histidine kinase
MQRNFTNNQPIKIILLAIILFIYESISSIFTYMSPLAGIIFIYLINNIENKEKYLINSLLLIYLSYFELDRGFFIFSSAILFVIYYNFLHKEISRSIICHNCLNAIYISIYYIGFYTINLLLSFIFGLELPKFDITYILYIITDTILIMM